MKKEKICVIGSDPEFLGGISFYIKEVLEYIKGIGNCDVFWIYGGRKDRFYKKDGVIFVELKCPRAYPLNQILFNIKILNFLNKNYFSIINSHAVLGWWIGRYKKKNKKQKIVHTYHGSTYYLYKTHLKRFGFTEKILVFLLMLYGYLIEKYPWKKADKVICVSEHVKKELEYLYGKRKNVFVIRNGVDLKKFKVRNKNTSQKKLNLEKDKIYGLYIGRGGYWTKGLDKVISLSKEIYNINKNFRLIAIGPDKKKVRRLLINDFIIFLTPKKRDKIAYYYNSADIFFSMSRYEGGAPTLVTAEAMASGCLIVTDKEANQEILKNNLNAIFVDKDYKKAAKKIIKIINNKKLKEEIIKNSLKEIKKLSSKKNKEKIIKLIFK